MYFINISCTQLFPLRLLVLLRKYDFQQLFLADFSSEGLWVATFQPLFI